MGSQLPSDRSYTGQLGVSRTTVTAAYQELKAWDLVRGYVGRGAIVVTDDPDRASTDKHPDERAKRDDRSHLSERIETADLGWPFVTRNVPCHP
ncbi:GntR family transcriptional regulator [Burkholderia sp. PAMC 28687]|uniref:GntR family transcriptional regulator n=1 Tax=Burkholderia sp. PAMC 28687 TaxID=1795874 RepID=UPI001E313C91|nr:GntR family transcriptional regulator [Burkholderia sp. PAMC 28687]